MAFLNRVRCATATTGTGTITFGIAVAGFLSPSEAGAVNGETYTYVLLDGNDFELGRGAYSTTGPTLTRATVLKSKIGGTAGTTKISLPGSATVFLTEAAEDFAGVRKRGVGEFFWFLASTAPAYALVLNGASLSRTTYADLWAYAQASGNLAATEGAKEAGQFGPGDGSTTFTLPNLTSGEEFIRAKGGSRAMGSFQADELKSHTHPYNRLGTGGTFADGAPNSRQLVADTTGATGGAETRPRNVALLPCVVF